WINAVLSTTCATPGTHGGGKAAIPAGSPATPECGRTFARRNAASPAIRTESSTGAGRTERSRPAGVRHGCLAVRQEDFCSIRGLVHFTARTIGCQSAPRDY